MSHYALELIIVYNLTSESRKRKWFQKIFTKSKENCHLNKMTHNIFGMKSSWKTFLDCLSMSFKIFYKDEFRKEYVNYTNIEQVKFPCAYIRKGNLLEPLVSKVEIETKGSVDDMIYLFYQHLNEKKMLS